MGTFQIKTPGGYEVEVRADDREKALDIAKKKWKSLPRIVAKDGKTRVLETRSGQRYVVSPGFSSSNKDDVERVLSGMSAGEVSRQNIDRTTIEQNKGAARLNEVVRGTPFIGSLTDEAAGAMFGEDAKAGVRALTGAMQRERPGETLGLNLGGGLLAGGAAAAAAPAAVSGAVSSALGQGPRLSQIGRGVAAGAGAGAIEGGIYGAGEGGEEMSRGLAARRGATFGAAGGGLLGGAAPVAREVAGNIASRFARSDISKIAKDLGISKDAAKVIKNTFDEGGDINAARANLQRAGDEAMLADAGPAAQALLDASAATGGRSGEIVNEAIDSRMSRTNKALRSAMDESLGPAPEGPRTAVNEIAERTAPARREAYEAAYSSPIDYASTQGRKIESVLDRVEPKVLMSAIEEANADMRAKGLQNMQIMASIGDDGSVVYREMPNVQQLDEIKKGLQRVAYENTDDFGRLSGKGQRYNKLAGELRDAVSESVPAYGEAVQVGGDKLAEERAFTLGEGLLAKRTNLEDVSLELGHNPSRAQVEATKSGLRDYIERALGDVRAIVSDPPGADALEARQVVKAVTDMSSDNARAKIRRLMGDEADALLAKIDEAAQSSAVRAAMAQNSKTAARQSIIKTTDEITSPGVVQNAMRGEVVSTTKALVKAATGQTDEYTAAQRQRIFSDIAKALTEAKGDNARAALGALQKAMEGQSLTDAQTDQLSKLIATTLFTASAPQVGRGIGAEYAE